MSANSVTLNGDRIVLGIKGLTYEGVALTHPFSNDLFTS